MVSEVKDANGLSLTPQQLSLEVHRCLSFGRVTQRQFESYVQTSPHSFKKYMILHTIFRKYASASGTDIHTHAIEAGDAVEFVTQVCLAMGQSIDTSMAHKFAREMMEEADTDLSSAIRCVAVYCSALQCVAVC